MAANNAEEGVVVNGVEIEATTPTLGKKPTRPHINAAIMVRVDGLGPEEALPGKAFLTYGIRPLPADINHELLSDEDTRWQGLFNERVEDDTPVYFENAEILNIVGPDEVGTASTTFTLRHTLAGVNTSVPCGSVTAGLFADLELGVDPNATSIAKSTVAGSSSSPQCNGKPQSNGVCYELIDMGAGKNFFDFLSGVREDPPPTHGLVAG